MTFEKIKDFYRKQLALYNPSDIRCMGWHDGEEYKMRFKLACEVADINGASVLDIGCGVGGFLNYLNDSGVTVKYQGIDVLPEMVDLFSRNHLGVSVKCANILEDEVERADYVFCIGAMNITEPNFSQTFRNMIRKMIELASKAVVISFLVDNDCLVTGQYHFEDPEELKQELECELGVKVIIFDREKLRGECMMFIYV